MTTQPTHKPATKRPRKMARQPNPQRAEAPQGANENVNSRSAVAASVLQSHAAKAATKTGLILGLLARSDGATLNQMVEATGWLPHTTRAALTGLKKKGHDVTSVKADGIRTYRVITVPQPKVTPTTEAESKPVA